MNILGTPIWHPLTCRRSALETLIAFSEDKTSTKSCVPSVNIYKVEEPISMLLYSMLQLARRRVTLSKLKVELHSSQKVEYKEVEDDGAYDKVRECTVRRNISYHTHGSITGLTYRSGDTSLKSPRFSGLT
jgi:hypothetical protein